MTARHAAPAPVPTDLLGSWRLRRRIVDRRLGLFGRATGTLLLTLTDSGVRWREDGRLAWNGVVGSFSRELRCQEDEDGWQVLFADGRPFHLWRPGALVLHPCRDDLYRGLLNASATVLRTLWDVCGPAKDQRILTRCVRQ
jgi:hypothetical protein